MNIQFTKIFLIGKNILTAFINKNNKTNIKTLSYVHAKHNNINGY
jgi:hypothetical protein